MQQLRLSKYQWQNILFMFSAIKQGQRLNNQLRSGGAKIEIALDSLKKGWTTSGKQAQQQLQSMVFQSMTLAVLT